MTIQTDIFNGDSNNTIFQTSMRYSEGSIKGYRVDSNNNESLITLIELGEKYIQTNIVIASNEKLKLVYDIFGTIPSDNKEEYDLKQRIRTLEKAVEDLYTLNKANQEALNNRVNIQAFQSWLRLIEKKLGIKLIDSNLGIIDSELYKF